MADRKRRRGGDKAVEQTAIVAGEDEREPNGLEPAFTAPEPTEPPPAGREGAGRRPRLRGRLTSVVALAVAVAAIGFVMADQLGPRRPAAGAPGASLSGAWLCPHGGGTDQRAWVAVTNPGTAPVSIRMTTFGSKGVLAVRSEVIPPSTQVYRPVPAKQAGAATEVEYFGAWAGAAWVVQRGRPDPALAASRCAGSPSPTWYLPDLPTGRGQRASVVVMNPFGEDAVIDVVIRTDRRAAVRPGQLTALVVPADTSRAISVNQYLLQAPSERIVSGEVLVKVGRVAVAAVDTSTGGVASEVGVADLAIRSNLPVAGATSSTLALLNPRKRRSDDTVIAQSDREQRVVSGAEGLSVGPESARAFGLPTPVAPGAGVDATNRAGVAVQRRVSGTIDDPALVGPAPFTASRWLLLPTLAPAGGHALVVIQNPGSAPVDVQVELLGPNGHVSTTPNTLRVLGGRATIVDVTSLSEGRPVSVLVTATQGTIVVGGSSYGAGDTGFAATLALPVPDVR